MVNHKRPDTDIQLGISFSSSLFSTFLVYQKNETMLQNSWFPIDSERWFKSDTVEPLNGQFVLQNVNLKANVFFLQIGKGNPQAFQIKL